MRARQTHWILIAGVLLLAAASVYGWLAFITNGIAYGDLVGLPGKDEQMALLARRAGIGLALGAGCEAAVVTLSTWLLLPPFAKRARIFTACAAGLLLVVFTFAAIKGA